MCGWIVLTLRMPSLQFLRISHIKNISSLGGFKTFTNSWDAKWLLRCNADFYKNSKACFGHLQNQRHIFVDDSYLQGDTQHECMNKINAAIDLLRSLGFLLGFLIYSKNMEISLTNKKAEHLTLKIKSFWLTNHQM